MHTGVVNQYETERHVADALRYISSDDRDTWVRIAMAVKSDLGDRGLDMWLSWSQQSEKYRESSALSTWRGVKMSGNGTGRIGLGTLFSIAQANGWRQGEAPPPIPKRDTSVFSEQEKRERSEARQRAQEAALTAHAWLGRAIYQEHPYLESKGFPEARGLVLKRRLLVPMRDSRRMHIAAMQVIDDRGAKKFQPYGCQVSGAVHFMGGRGGTGAMTWYVEGFATGLSVYAALKSLYRPDDRVLVGFSAHNMMRVAMERKSGIVIADNDASGTGERVARETGLRWWQPPDVGDANDHMQTRGLDALADAIRGVIYD